jgi:hypothetical protein
MQRETISQVISMKKIDAHPLFRIIDGEIEPWEKLN